MFFFLSKTLGFFCDAVECADVDRDYRRRSCCVRGFGGSASWLIVTSVVLIAVAGYSPLGNILILPLEQRFPAVGRLARTAGRHRRARRRHRSRDIDGARRCRAQRCRRADHRRRRTGAPLSECAHDFLRRQRLDLGRVRRPEAPAAVQANSRRSALRMSASRRGAVAQYRRECRVLAMLADPKPGERWLLVTSAFHMPRAIGTFRAAGFRRWRPIRWTWRTRGPIDARRPFTELPMV